MRKRVPIQPIALALVVVFAAVSARPVIDKARTNLLQVELSYLVAGMTDKERPSLSGLTTQSAPWPFQPAAPDDFLQLTTRSPLIWHRLALLYAQRQEWPAAATAYARFYALPELSSYLPAREQPERLFGQYRYAEAFQRYARLADSPSARPQAPLFYAMVTAVYTRRADAAGWVQRYRLDDPEFIVYPPGETVAIEGRDLRMVLTDRNRRIAGGRPAQSPREAGVTVFSSYGGAVALVDIADAGVYSLSIEARHDAPPPVELLVGANGVPLIQYVLARGDDSWEQLQLDLHLVPGIHAVNLWFMNDYRAGNDDRNLFVRRITLTRAPAAQGRRPEQTRTPSARP